MMLDILEEHLEEASWLHDVRAHLLRSYHVTLRNLEEWDERWLAHVDGLVIGAEHARPIIEKGLAEGDDGAVCAAAAVLACRGGTADRERLEATLLDPAFKGRAPLLLGLGLAPFTAHEKWLEAWIRSGTPALRAAAAETLRFRGIAPPLEAIRPLFRDQPPEVVRAALRLVGDLKIVGCNAYLEAALDAPDPGVRSAAGPAATLAGLRSGRDRWRAALRAAGPAASPEDLVQLGTLGTPEDLPLLVAALQAPPLAAAAIRGLGLLGHPGAAEPLLTPMADRTLAPLAGHAFSFLFGIDLERDGLAAVADPTAPAAERDEIDPFEGLTCPDPARVGAWWKQSAARFARTTRWRLGRPFQAAAPAATLRDGRLADRHPAALEVALTARDVPRLETRDLATRQRRWAERHLASLEIATGAPATARPGPAASGAARPVPAAAPPAGPRAPGPRTGAP